MATCTAITAFAPSIFAKSIFAPRRANKSIEADNMPVSIMNGCVAGAQLGKIGEGVIGIAHETKSSIASKIVDIDNALREVPKSDSIFKGAGKAARFGMEHINGLIGATGVIKVAYSNDKTSTAIQEGTAITGMLAFEGAHKAIFGSSSSKCINGENQIEVKEGLYRKSKTLSRAADSFVELCNKNGDILKECGGVKRFIGKMLKFAPAGIKGISFAGTSIAGYAICNHIGHAGAKMITGRETA